MNRESAFVKNIFAEAVSIVFLCGAALLVSTQQVSAADILDGPVSRDAQQAAAKRQKVEALWNSLDEDDREAIHKVLLDSNNLSTLWVSLIALLGDGEKTEAVALLRNAFPAVNDRRLLVLVEFFSYANGLDRPPEKP
jgi:hypothetical protein